MVPVTCYRVVLTYRALVAVRAEIKLVRRCLRAKMKKAKAYSAREKSNKIGDDGSDNGKLSELLIRARARASRSASLSNGHTHGPEEGIPRQATHS